MRLTVRSGPFPERLRADAERELRRLAPAIAGLSRALHANPELSLEEHAASKRLAGFLRRQGFTVRFGAGGLKTAFVARRRGRARGPRLAFLAEYDALPGIGHACGHNLIGAAAVGAGAVVGKLITKLRGEILVIGTPAEETIGGKALMADRGVFRGLDAALMIHPSQEDRVYTTSLACHSLEVTYRGRAAHAVAAPERGINALHALLRLFQELDRLRPRLSPEVRMPGVIVEGGRRANIVPDRAVGRFTLRARDLATLRGVERSFRVAVTRAGREVGARAVVRSLDHTYAEMRTNRVMADLFKEELRRAGRGTVDTPRKRMGSLDMGNVSQRVPAIHPYVAIAPANVPLHSRRFERFAGGPRGRAGLAVATRALALTAARLLADPHLLQRVRREFRGRSGAPRATVRSR